MIKIDISKSITTPQGITSIDTLLNGGLPALAKLYPAEPIPEGIRKIFSGESEIVIGQAEQRYLFGGGKSSLNFHQIISDKTLAKRLVDATWVVYDYEVSAEKFRESLKNLRLWVENNETTS